MQKNKKFFFLYYKNYKNARVLTSLMGKDTVALTKRVPRCHVFAKRKYKRKQQK